MILHTYLNLKIKHTLDYSPIGYCPCGTLFYTNMLLYGAVFDTEQAILLAIKPLNPKPQSRIRQYLTAAKQHYLIDDPLNRSWISWNNLYTCRQGNHYKKS
jgi:hypothetical protein